MSPSEEINRQEKPQEESEGIDRYDESQKENDIKQMHGSQRVRENRLLSWGSGEEEEEAARGELRFDRSPKNLARERGGTKGEASSAAEPTKERLLGLLRAPTGISRCSV